MSEGNAHKISYVVEVTRGTTPANPVYQELPDNRTTLNLAKETLATDRLSGNRFPSKPRTGAQQVNGDIPADLSFGAYDAFIESALLGAFVEDGGGLFSIAKAGATRKSFSFLREFSDMTGKKFLTYKGCEVATWALSAAANGIAKSTFTFWGREMGDPSTTAPAGSTFEDAIDTEPFDTFNGEMKIDGAATCIVTDYSLTINNGHAPQFSVGCATSRDARVGQSVIEGSITVYFDNMTLYEKFLNEDSLSLELTLEDSLGNQMVIALPELKILTGTQPDVSGDESITLPISFSAHYDDALGSHISVKTIPIA
jgi:hypothetical protein